jgi:hypothetical protein
MSKNLPTRAGPIKANARHSSRKAIQVEEKSPEQRLREDLSSLSEKHLERAWNTGNGSAQQLSLAQREAAEQKYEPGAEGRDQGLIPGVEPVTDKERLDLDANKPLQGGDAEPPSGGLF